MPAIANDEQYLQAAIDKVTGMLSAKKDIWTYAAPIFENFDIHEVFGVSGLQLGLTMCNLKLNRLKNCWRKSTTTGPVFQYNPDSEDTLIDLASYALLTLGLLYREKGRLTVNEEPFLCSPEGRDIGLMQGYVDAYIASDEGKAEIASLAAELMDAPPSSCVGPQQDPLHQFCPDLNCHWGGNPSDIEPITEAHYHGTYESNESPCYEDCTEQSKTPEYKLELRNIGPLYDLAHSLAEYCPKCGASWSCTLSRCINT